MANSCTNCGTSNPHYQKFCSNCGYRMEGSSSKQIQSSINQKKSQNVSVGIIVNCVIIGIIAILVITFVVVGLNTTNQVSVTSKPKNTSNYTSDMLFEEIMDIHAECLAKMVQIRDKEKKIRRKALNPSNSSDWRIEYLNKKTADNLLDINEKLLRWMRNFNNDFEGNEVEKKIYFLEQKKELKELKKLMEEALR